MRSSHSNLKTAAEAWIPDAWIIEDELRQERERQERERPYLELPLNAPETYSDAPSSAEDAPKRGVIVIDL